MEKLKKEITFKQNAYEEIRRFVENNEVDEAVAVNGKKKKNTSNDNSYNFELFD